MLLRVLVVVFRATWPQPEFLSSGAVLGALTISAPLKDRMTADQRERTVLQHRATCLLTQCAPKRLFEYDPPFDQARLPNARTVAAGPSPALVERSIAYGVSTIGPRHEDHSSRVHLGVTAFARHQN